MAWTAEQVKAIRTGLGLEGSRAPITTGGQSTPPERWTAEKVAQIRENAGLTYERNLSNTAAFNTWTDDDKRRLYDVRQQIRWQGSTPELEQEQIDLITRMNAANPSVVRSFGAGVGLGAAQTVGNAIPNLLDVSFAQQYSDDNYYAQRRAMFDLGNARVGAFLRGEDFDEDAYLAERTQYHQIIGNEKRGQFLDSLAQRGAEAQAETELLLSAYAPNEKTANATQYGISAGQQLPLAVAEWYMARYGVPLNIAKGISRALFFGNVFGNEIARTYAETGDMDMALRAGLGTGAAEAIPEYLFGGVLPDGGVVTKLLRRAGVNNFALLGLADVAGGMLGEAVEEAVTEFVTPYIDRSYVGRDTENASFEEILSAAKGGAIMAALFGFGLGQSQAEIRKGFQSEAAKARASASLQAQGYDKKTADMAAAAFQESVIAESEMQSETGKSLIERVVDKFSGEKARELSPQEREALEKLRWAVATAKEGDQTAESATDPTIARNAAEGEFAGVDRVQKAAYAEAFGDTNTTYQQRVDEAHEIGLNRAGDVKDYTDAREIGLLSDTAKTLVENRGDSAIQYDAKQADAVSYDAASNTITINPKKVNLNAVKTIPALKEDSASQLYNESGGVYNDNGGMTDEQRERNRRFEEAGLRLSYEDTQLYWGGSKKADRDAIGLLSRILRRELGAQRNRSGNRNESPLVLHGKENAFNVYPNVDAALFHDVFSLVRGYTQNGELVDVHNAKTSEDGVGYEDCDCYLSDDGLAGFAITKDGDLISVFNANREKPGFLYAISDIVKRDAKTLDCYMSPNQPLSKMYERVFGFKLASVMEYNMEYDHDNIAENHNSPQVAFMVNTAEDVPTRYFDKNSFDEAKAYQMSFTDAPADAEAFSNAQNGFGPNSVGAAQSQFKKQQKVRGAAKNSLRNSPMFTAAEKRVLELNKDEDSPYKYDVVSNEESWYNAANRLQADYDGEKQHLSKKDVFSGEDMFTAALMMEVERDNARESGDYTETKRIASMMAEQGTEGGRIIQMLSQIAGTPEGVLVKGETFFLNRAKKWADAHPKQSKAIDAVADKLRGQDPSKISLDEVKQTLLDAGLSKKGIDNVAEQLTEYLGSAKRNKREVRNALRLVYANGFIELSDADTKRVIELLEQAFEYPENSRKYIELEKQAYSIIASKMNASALDKWNAWRYLAMLGNTRTHVRNLLGNSAFRVVVGAKDSLAGLMEATVDATSKVLGGEGIERTKTVKSLLTKRGKALRQAALKDAENVYGLLTQGGKYNDAFNKIEQNKKVFKVKPLEWLRNASGNALEWEDWLSLKNDYADFLAKYLYANGHTTEVFELNDAYAQEVMEKARKYAIDQAQKATFRNANAAAQGLSQIAQKLKEGDTFASKAGYFLLEGVMPFKNTPFNILARGVEYSPVGLLSTMGKAFNAVRTGKYTATDVIDSLAANLTGTAILLLGKFLADLGILRGSIDDDKEGQAEKLQGHQEYALELGNGSYTIDWLAPAAIPLFIGAELSKLQNEVGGADFNDVITAALSLAEPITEMTMMQGVNDILECLSYGEENTALYNIASTALTNYATQGLPTLLGQIARTIDPYRRTSAGDSKGAKGDIEYIVRKAMNKIPGLSFLNEEYIDAWGREQKNAGDNAVVRGLLQTLSPGYYSPINETAVDRELQEIFEETDDDSVFLSSPSRNAKFDGESRRMTAEEYSDFSRVKGQTAHDMLDELFKYYDIPDEYKTEVVGDIYKYANAIAKYEVGADLTDDWTYKALVLEEKGIDPLDYILYRNFASTDGNNTISQKEAKSFLDDMAGLTREQKAFIWEMTNKSWTTNPYK